MVTFSGVVVVHVMVTFSGVVVVHVMVTFIWWCCSTCNGVVVHVSGGVVVHVMVTFIWWYVVHVMLTDNLVVF